MRELKSWHTKQKLKSYYLYTLVVVGCIAEEHANNTQPYIKI